MEQARTGQLEVVKRIKDAFDSGKKFVIAEMPTGWGKSVIGKTLANMYQKTCYITPQILLQEQLIGDFGEEGKFQSGHPMVHLKGRSNYKCVYSEIADISESKRKELRAKNMDCSTGYCKRDGKSMCGACVTNPDYKIEGNKCPYWQRVYKYLQSPIGLMNFKSFMFQMSFSSHFEGYSVDLLIIDEAHNQEKEVLDFVSVSFNEEMFIRYLSMKMPKYKTVEEYSDFFEKEGLAKRLLEEAAIARGQERFGDAEKMENLAVKMLNFIKSDKGNWVLKIDDKNKRKTNVELKPIFVDQDANRLLYKHADKVLIMSATILSADVMCESLGINKDDMEFIQMPSNFPVENRPIFFLPVGSMSYRNKDATMPKMVEAIDEVCRNFKGERGIIHTHSFANCDAVMQGVSPETRNRILFQKHFSSRDEMLEVHRESDDTIIVAPALHEGIDLKEDLSRFQIIMKVPYPNFKDDPQLAARMDLSQDYYNLLVCLKIVQSYGRSIRSETDYAETYIFDSDFSRLLNMCGHLLPPWFKEAIQ